MSRRAFTITGLLVVAWSPAWLVSNSVPGWAQESLLTQQSTPLNSVFPDPTVPPEPAAAPSNENFAPEADSEQLLERRPEPTIAPNSDCPVNTAMDFNQILAELSTGETSELLPTGQHHQVKDFYFLGNRVFSEEHLREEIERQLELKRHGQSESQSYTFPDLVAIAGLVTAYYNDKGYINSFATVPVQVADEEGQLAIAVIEGGLEKIQLHRPEGEHHLSNRYICDRLALAARPLHLDNLFDALQQLRLNPLIKQVQGELIPGIDPESSILVVRVVEAKSFSITTGLDNGRPPSVGTQRQVFQLSEGNFTGGGDRLDLTWSRTHGSDNLEGRYTVPLNARDGTLAFSVSRGISRVIEEPFAYLDLAGNSRAWGLELRQPLAKTSRSEVVMTVGLGHRLSQTSILGFNVPLSEGADAQGRLRVTKLTWGQDWTRRSDQDFLVLRSQFNFGLDALAATVNETAPDGRFFHWQTNGVWLHRWPNQAQLLMQGALQLSDRPLLAQEQYTLGGLGTVRGYRQDVVSRDNGAFFSMEYQHPLLGQSADPWGGLAIASFFDWGVAWQSAQRAEKEYQTLASLGLGLVWTVRSELDLTVRAYWGQPLMNVDSRDNTLQEQGFHFLIQSRWSL